ncbi:MULTISPECIES: hypothetical protein [unclassified Rhizobacter]|uniref:hypothetical protein n=1 Tax=unclassified Rhizobacter TaxID=2640088 RepID=UPI0006F4F9B3|nr:MULTISPECIES: hypothetical protein [unclassified Rhizobacter]KQU80318.1 hypothetical protein ASC88_16940 [Rhizobacter sp. Root29]KQW13816.1 hypothetical protein ASC98_17070 [Rhizobacter sp. Root1238]KRB20348.1 hypothetical protein ASE08_22105 [Rhizobacter sp. Root16D2]
MSTGLCTSSQGFDRLSPNGMRCPFTLSLSKGPIILSLSKDLSLSKGPIIPSLSTRLRTWNQGFDKLGPTLRQAQGERG